MKIALSGVHSTGKTTIINEIVNQNLLPNYQVIESMTRGVRDLNFDINSNGSDVSQAIIITDHFRRIDLSGDLIFDRCALDGYAYTKALFEMGKVSSSIMEYAKVMFERTISKYDIIFYLEPEFDIVDDGTREINYAFRNDVLKCFREIIKEYFECIECKIFQLTGSVEDRVNQMLTIISAKIEYRR